MIEWQWSRFSQLSTSELHDILQLRAAVFIVEQQCAYQDIDGLDSVSWHLMAWALNENKTRTLKGYLRVVDPGLKYQEPAIGRVLTSLQVRGQGIGKLLMREAISHIECEYGHGRSRISAQTHLQAFYAGFGFQAIGEPYDEDDIPHIEMLRQTEG